jgi:hypothetical protein
VTANAPVLAPDLVEGLRRLKLAAMRQLALTSLEWITARENLCRVGPAVLQGVAWGNDLGRR